MRRFKAALALPCLSPRGSPSTFWDWFGAIRNFQPCPIPGRGVPAEKHREQSPVVCLNLVPVLGTAWEQQPLVRLPAPAPAPLNAHSAGKRVTKSSANIPAFPPWSKTHPGQGIIDRKGTGGEIPTSRPHSPPGAAKVSVFPEVLALSPAGFVPGGKEEQEKVECWVVVPKPSWQGVALFPEGTAAAGIRLGANFGFVYGVKGRAVPAGTPELSLQTQGPSCCAGVLAEPGRERCPVLKPRIPGPFTNSIPKTTPKQPL